jgi:DMSO/TMAO reductase YedYZ molybdopterin-dependent catalytic subunit
MKRQSVLIGAFFGFALGAPLAALMFLLSSLSGVTFAAFDLFDWISRTLPGPLVTFAIDSMISLQRAIGIDVASNSKSIERLLGTLTFVAILIIGGAVYGYFIDARESTTRRGLLAGFIVGMPLAGISWFMDSSDLTAAINAIIHLIFYLVWGAALGWVFHYYSQTGQAAIEPAAETVSTQRLNRRQFLLVLGGGAATVTVVGAGLSRLLTTSGGDGGSSVASNIPLPNADDPVVPPPGMRPEFTPIEDHYKVFITSEPPVVPEEGWVLPVHGLVNNPVELTLDQIRDDFTPIERFNTISCISGRVHTGLIGTVLWTGFSLQELLDLVQPTEDARYLIIRSEDDFHETIDLDLIRQDERLMLSYAWNREPIPDEHGFPVRVWIPDRYGMKQPKWIIDMEFSDTYEQGYWVQRGWDEDAIVRTTSAIDVIASNDLVERDGQQFVPIGGYAWAGDRGISRVEVRVDGGQWQEALLRTPLSDTTWVFWRFEWPFAEGDHTFEVRCVDGEGTPQIEQEARAHPSGSTGIHMEEESF